MKLKKPSVYIPIEIKYREYHSSVLLATKLSQRGFRTYIGSKKGIYEIIHSKNKTAGIFLYKGMKPRDFFGRLKRYCDKICILDQELGVAHIQTKEHYKEAVLDRLLLDSIDLIDLFFVIGQKYYDAVLNVAPSLESRLYISGWPRIDLWLHHAAKVYDSEKKSIQKQHGHFLLFASDFGINTIEKLNGAFEQDKMSGVQFRMENAQQKYKNYEALFREYESMVEFLKSCDADQSIPKIIIRPHPGEDKEAWRSAMAGLKKTEVIYEGDSTTWILASAGVLHRGCSSGVEASLMGRPNAYLILQNFVPRNNLSFICAERVTSLQDLAVFAKNCSSVHYNKSEITNTLISKSDGIFALPAPSSSDFISDLLAKFNITPEKIWERGSIGKFKLRIQRLKYEILKNIFRKNQIDKIKKFNLAPKAEKMPGGITVDETQKFITSLGYDNIEVVSPLKDVVVIE